MRATGFKDKGYEFYLGMQRCLEEDQVVKRTRSWNVRIWRATNILAQDLHIGGKSIKMIVKVVSVEKVTQNVI